jgi:carboxylesterase
VTILPLLPGAEPFSVDGGPIGVLLSHGFTGMPSSMRPWADRVAAAGYTVRLPLLPWQDMNTTRWTDWYATIEASFTELRQRCEQVFVCGLSMGGTLVTKLAEDHGGDVAGIVLVNPSYGTRRFDTRFAKFIAPVVTSRPGIGSDIKAGGVEGGYDRVPLKAFVSLQKLWDVVAADLGRVTAPVRLFTSREDHVVDSLSAQLLHERATNTTVEQTWLENSYHVATLDNDAEQIFDGSLQFIGARSTAAAAGPDDGAASETVVVPGRPT